MKGSKLIDTLKKFDHEEISRLKLFINSAYFVNRQTLAEFANIILNEYPLFESTNLDVRNLYQVLYPEKPFQQKTVFKLMGLMMSHIHQFLAIENFLNDQTEASLRLMEQLRKKGIRNEFLRVAAKLNDDVLSDEKDQQFYYNLVRYENELVLYYNLNKEHLGYSKHLNNQSVTLDTYYMYAKLKVACEMINRQKSFTMEYDLSFLEPVMKYIESNPEKFRNVPAIGIYYQIILTILNPEEQKNYKQLALLLEEVQDNIENNELRDMYGFAQNYCIKKINSGEFEFVRELFNLYCKLLDKGIIYENNHLTQWDYKNIATIGLRLKEYEWTENFIVSNRDRVLLNFRDVSYRYNLANLYYEKKDFTNALRNLNFFNDALKQISDPEFDDIFYNLDSRAMFLKIYYELGEDETFKATLDTFKSYLIRNKRISEAQKSIYINLLKYTKKLNDQRQRVKYSPMKSTRFNIKKIKNEINSNKNIVNLSWLQARVEELEKEVG